MTKLTKTTLAAALALASGFTLAQPLFVGDGMEIGNGVAVTDGAPVCSATSDPVCYNDPRRPILRFTAFATHPQPLPLSQIEADGSVKFVSPTATVDFSSRGHFDRAGPQLGYVVVKIGGRAVLIPYYEVPDVPCVRDCQ